MTNPHAYREKDLTQQLETILRLLRVISDRLEALTNALKERNDAKEGEENNE